MIGHLDQRQFHLKRCRAKQPRKRLGDRTPANFPGPFTSPHGIAADSRGDIYVGEVAKTGWGNLFPGVTPDRPRAVLQKLVKVA